MNEMIYGNTGKRDEGINIDMAQSLYQKLQSRTFVPKLKSMLNDHLQEGDRNFVFIGEVADKAGNFSVYGYNAKLESDSRGGDYGHYIAVPANEKTVSVDTDNVGFLTEEGFVEYVNLKTLNGEKRFKIFPESINIDKNSEKRIVNNLMETFMKVRKRKNVTFSFEDCAAEEFSAKSLFVLTDLLKYIPYCMRKNISFISRVASNQKLPDMINLAAYPASSEFKPHDCIALNAGAALGNDGIFSEYVEKVFAMNEQERTSYFEKLYNNIECPAVKAGVDVRADLYLMDVSTKKLWTAGNAKEAIANIFSSVDDILKIYPEYREIAKKRIDSEKKEFVEYISAKINSSANTEELKTAYKSICALFEVCGLVLDEITIGFFKTRASEFIKSASDADKLIKVLDGIVSIDDAILDRELAGKSIRQHMSKETDINGIYELYLKLKGKNFILPQELNICLTESVEENILNAVGKYTDSKDKLSALERIYDKFRSETSSKDYPRVKEVYDTYKVKFSSGARNETVSKGNEILFKIGRELNSFSNFYDTKNYIKELADIEVNADEELKRKVSDIYRRVSAKLFYELKGTELSYDEFEKLINEITPAINMLNDNQVYDNVQRSGWGEEKYVPDGMYRFVGIFGSLMDRLRRTEDLSEALLAFENSNGSINDDEQNIKIMFDRFGGVILVHWFGKHSKSATERGFKKAEKELNKRHNIRLSRRTENIIDRYSNCRSGKKKGVGKSFVLKFIIAVIVVLAIIAVAVFGGIKLYKIFFEQG